MGSLQDLLLSLERDQPVVFPTDTVPALAIRPSAAQRIWTLKQRPAHKPLILMGADQAQLQEALGVAWPGDWQQEAQQVWPGAVTLVFPLVGPLRQALNPGGQSLGLRVPACDRARAFLRHAGPLATTSVNRSGEPAALCEADVRRLFPDLPLLGPYPWPAGSGIPSEVRSWSETGWTILRPHHAQQH
ncbi:MAG: L-threonylcarbamoyladenylate synthase [Cyanobacteriota bacterium]|nr:L-threonylcarbamoyladenylate synthase [Cyanobacteriota bacterium]